MSEAVAAIIGAVLALSGVTATLAVQLKRDRQEFKWRESVERERRASDLEQRQFEVLTTAVGYLEGGSQRRNVGLAMLAILRQLEDKDQEAVFRLILTQARYLLAHGSNRWEGHELANLEGMLEILLGRGQTWLEVVPGRVSGFRADVDRFLNDSEGYMGWDPEADRKDGGRPNISAIEHIREVLKEAKVHLVDKAPPVSA
ncbi:hypothetical protein [Geodermatophilus sp. URMC 63]